MSLEKEEIKCPSCKNLVPITYAYCPYCGYDLRPFIRLEARKQISFREILFRRIPFTIIKPHKIFREIALSPDLIGPFFIFFITSLIISIRYIKFISPFSIEVYLLLALSTLLILVIWNIFSAMIIHLIVKLMGGTADFTTTFSIFGYSYIPPLFGFLAVSLRIIFSEKNIILNIESLKSIFLQSTEIILISLIISGILISLGISYAHGLDLKLSFLASYISIGILGAIMYA